MAKVVIFGLGQFAELAYYFINSDSKHEVIAFTVDGEYLSKKKFFGHPVVEFSRISELYPPQTCKLFIPISYKKLNKIREEKYLVAKKQGYKFINVISSKALIYNSKIGENCFIFENNIIQPFSKIGNNCIIWSGNHIGHHSVIEDHCFISSQVVISGNSVIGKYSFLGVNSTIRDNIKIGTQNIIGAGSLILKNTKPKSVFSPKGTEVSRVPSDKIKII
jgi:sugar O-acyltransferase (sialic acid O-acetyltransferase NeuD family)